MVSGSRGSSCQQGSSRQAVVRLQETASKQVDSLARARAQPLKKKASRHRSNSDSFIHEAKKTLDLSARSVTSKKSKEKQKETRFPVGLVPEQELKETRSR